MKNNLDTSKDNSELLSNFLNKLTNSYSIDSKTKIINLNLRGTFKILSEEEIIIELGDIIPYLTKKSILKSKNKIVLFTKFIFEILIRQFTFLSQINFSCSIYYAKKSNDVIDLRNHEFEDNIAFSFINLQ